MFQSTLFEDDSSNSGNQYQKVISKDEIEVLNRVSLEKGELTNMPIQAPEGCVPFPSALVRSQLFATITTETYCKKYGIPVDKANKFIIDNEMIASWKGVEIFYTGVLLNQTDLDVFLILLDGFRDMGMGYIGGISLRQIAKRLNGSTRTDKISESIDRLTKATIKINMYKNSGSVLGVYTGHLIDETFKDDRSHYYIKINHKFSDLFSVSGYVLQELPKRLSLGKSQLSKWLYGYVLSHDSSLKKPHKVYLATLQNLSGSEFEKRIFKHRVKKVMENFVQKEVIKGWNLDDVEQGLTFWKN